MELLPTNAGLHAIGWLAKEFDDVAAVEAAEAKGIDSVALSTLTLNREMSPAIILGVANADNRAIRRGVEELARVLQQLRRVQKYA
jgi:GntR family transcriptional regulator/MocR family aminotransferase